MSLWEPAPDGPDALDAKMADAWNRAVDRMEAGEGACPACGYSLGSHPELCDTCHEHVTN